MELVLRIFFDMADIFVRTNLLTEQLGLVLKLLLLGKKAALDVTQVRHPGVFIHLSTNKNHINGSKNNEQ
jgi:hypothetical protein